jgi:hypothetical protein
VDRCRPTAFDSTQQPHRQHDELSRPALCTEQLPDARGPSARNAPCNGSPEHPPKRIGGGNGRPGASGLAALEDPADEGRLAGVLEVVGDHCPFDRIAANTVSWSAEPTWPCSGP